MLCKAKQEYFHGIMVFYMYIKIQAQCSFYFLLSSKANYSSTYPFASDAKWVIMTRESVNLNNVKRKKGAAARNSEMCNTDLNELLSTTLWWWGFLETLWIYKMIVKQVKFMFRTPYWGLKKWCTERTWKE